MMVSKSALVPDAWFARSEMATVRTRPSVQGLV